MAFSTRDWRWLPGCPSPDRASAVGSHPVARQPRPEPSHTDREWSGYGAGLRAHVRQSPSRWACRILPACNPARLAAPWLAAGATAQEATSCPQPTAPVGWGPRPVADALPDSLTRRDLRDR